jgi:hypothetical protein
MSGWSTSSTRSSCAGCPPGARRRRPMPQWRADAERVRKYRDFSATVSGFTAENRLGAGGSGIRTLGPPSEVQRFSETPVQLDPSRPTMWFAATPRWEGDGFELSVPGHETVKPSWETALLSRKRKRICWGTESSNPPPSSGESGANLRLDDAGSDRVHPDAALSGGWIARGLRNVGHAQRAG